MFKLRIRKYAYLTAYSDSSVFEAYQFERKDETDSFFSIFIPNTEKCERGLSQF